METELVSSSLKPLCRFHLMGKCKFQEKCCMRHDYSPEGTIENARKMVLCTYLSKPKGCQHGTNCIFSHSQEEINKLIEKLYVVKLEEKDWNDHKEEEEEEKMCGICHCSIQSEGKRFALLEGCSHSYCVECIKEWHAKRKETTVGRPVHTVLHSCPECRVESRRIEASHVFLDGQEKIELFKKCEEKRKLTKCKYFKGELGTCRYGSKCQYAHLDADGNDLKSKDKRKPNKRKTSSYDHRGRVIGRWGLPGLDAAHLQVQLQLIRQGFLEAHGIIDSEDSNLMFNALRMHQAIMGHHLSYSSEDEPDENDDYEYHEEEEDDDDDEELPELISRI